jgi:hypothetical protein
MAAELESLSISLRNPLGCDVSSLSVPATAEIRKAVREHEQARRRHDDAEKACKKLRID